ncbi:SDR family oxidoreductase [Rhodocytophaga aerolata]|uniref:SDR family oxidoreductase n=1 Tax=Rhodocytophaga aerolata TaxID=455078 RepID=A0ABT8R098_9BACT|nr:SDR family oxidoreductase [Rhodocytophaga aerolata]MDO1444834.1 SDR family oxidoreductase [Rhodocytophaga aerolata]
MKLKPLAEQVILITGATSGIGLTTARMAARKGAKVVLVARNRQALEELTDELNASGNKAIFSEVDVSDEAALQQAATAAIQRFGRIDTWVNNAGVSIYGKITEISMEDQRRLFETNFWGVVLGSRIAVQHLAARGGAIINIGSVLSDRAISLQGTYSASKHAVKGFTDALRMELEQDNLPISVTLIKPSAINTPYPQHAKNYQEKEATLPPPVFAPDLVAEAILHCAENSVRDFTVGEGKLLGAMGQVAPRLMDKMMEKDMSKRQFKDEPKPSSQPDGLYQTQSALQERGEYEGMVLENSLLQKAKLNPVLAGVALVGGGVALAALLSGKKKQIHTDETEDIDF